MRSLVQQSGYVLDNVNNIWTSTGYTGIDYSDGDDVEAEIARVIEQASDISVLSAELRSHCTDWPSLYHLSSTRANIMRPFEKILTGDVLEIGAGCGAITRYLGECGANVLALEGSPRRAAIARSRTRDLENVTVLAEKFDQFQCNHQFDVITLIGVLEYANLFTSGENPHIAMLEMAHALLKPEGRLVIAIENQLGLKYFAGAPEDHHSVPMYGIEGRYKSNQAETFGHRTLLDMILQAGLQHVETLAPFPDYKMPVSILTEQGAAATDFDAGALAWQSVKKDPQLPYSTLFSMERTWPVISRNLLAIELGNSFLIVASNRRDKVVERGHLAFHYSSDRAAKYSKEIIFSRAAAGRIELGYRALCCASKPEETANQNLIYRRPETSVYVLGVPLSYRFVEIVTSPGWSIPGCLVFFKDYFESLRDCLQSDGNKLKDLHAGTILPGDYLDAIPGNIIIDNEGRATYIDREWCAIEGVLLDYLLFRSIMSLLGSISLFAIPADGEPTTRGGFTIEVMEGLGFFVDEETIAKFLESESDLSIFSSGIEDRIFSSWQPEQALPGLAATPSVQYLETRLAEALEAKNNAEILAYSHLAEVVELQAQLAVMDEAKSGAEELAHSHFAEMAQLQAQLAVMDEAKSGAEELAHSHLAEVVQLQVQLAATEEAKSRAEELAHSHLADLVQSQEQLAATEAAKDRAENLAHSHLEAKMSIESLAADRNKEVEAIRSSSGYKMLSALKLVPIRNTDDV
jgi:SAM-dependent methyltransferase